MKRGCGGRLFGFAGGTLFFALASPLGCSLLAHRGSVGHAVQPAANRLLSAYVGGSPGQHQERRLKCVLRVVPVAQHAVVERLSNRFFRVSIYYGFMEAPDIPAALDWCCEQGLSLDPMTTSYFLGRETVIPRVGSGMAGWRNTCSPKRKT